MANTQTLISEVYTAFNQRDIDRAFALMSESVSWPKASEGGRVVGKEAIRAYWSRQWKEFDPHVDPIEVIDRATGQHASGQHASGKHASGQHASSQHASSQVEVRVHQLVKSLDGNVLSDSEVRHFYVIADGLIERMDLEADGADSELSPSAAFQHR